jgi:molybdate transport repressor ModE-like protein
MSRTQQSRPRALSPRVKIWLEAGGCYAFGFGLSDILQAVDRAGSIKQAARDVGKSYRHVWGRIKEAERALGEPLVESQVGGAGSQRSALTPRGRRLVEQFLAFRRRVAQFVEAEFALAFDPE